MTLFSESGEDCLEISAQRIVNKGSLLAETLQGCILSLIMLCICFSDFYDEVGSMFSTPADVTNLVE